MPEQGPIESIHIFRSGLLMQMARSTERRSSSIRRWCVRPFLAGAVEGIRRFKNDKLFAKRQIGKYLRVEDDKVLEETHQLFADLFERVPYIKREGLTSLVQILAESDAKMAAVKVDSMVEDRFVRELESSGFIKSVYR